MNSSGDLFEVTGAYTISDTKLEHTFYGVKMPPPCGYFGVNYSRYVSVHLHKQSPHQNCSHTHFERCPHKFGIAWTTRKGCHPVDDNGANFYMANYAIKVESAQNTAVVWRPGEWHGTTLPQRDPLISRPESSQAGISLVTSSSVAEEWKKEMQKT